MAMAISVPLYTVDDLDGFPRDGNRYELLDGVLLVTPASSMSRWRLPGTDTLVSIGLEEIFTGLELLRAGSNTTG